MYLRSRGNSVHQDLDACQKVFAVSSACAVIVVACLALFLDESSDSCESTYHSLLGVCIGVRSSNSLMELNSKFECV
jgi:hypothetical protein